MKCKVLGLKRWSGQLDGKQVDSGKLFVEVRLDDSRNDANAFSKGYATEELRVGVELVKRLEHLPVPFDADVITERVSNGKTAREAVIDVRPIDIVKPQKVA